MINTCIKYCVEQIILRFPVKPYMMEAKSYMIWVDSYVEHLLVRIKFLAKHCTTAILPVRPFTNSCHINLLRTRLKTTYLIFHKQRQLIWYICSLEWRKSVFNTFIGLALC